jgi:hypothetical protein
MPFKPGTSGNPGGQLHAKPFREALRMQIAAAGDNQKALRRVAQALIDRAATGDVSAIVAIADRLDGRPAQTTGQDAELGPARLVISWKSDTDGTQAQVIETTVPHPLLLTPPPDDDAGGPP